ncbi:hypothetical protein QJQ45_019899 [Haematococcus lacustris]|nr:hypothetical protein QJQ45_019899 [Haematococcus lacustris]
MTHLHYTAMGAQGKQLHGTRAPSCSPVVHISRPHRVRTCAVSGTSLVQAQDMMELGKSGLRVPVMGVGAWSWGDRSGYWGYGREYGKEESRQAYKALLEAGLTFIDTAEVYGFGDSENFLGEFMRESGTSSTVQIATKFAPLPWRLTAGSVPTAAKASLERLGLAKMSLYMQHWPGFFFNTFSNDAYLEGLASVKNTGLADAIGVSNFNAQRVRHASKVLAKSGVPLASNQVQYSLLYRAPERNGVLEACREAGTTLVAYSPLCQGLLTGHQTSQLKLNTRATGSQP